MKDNLLFQYIRNLVKQKQNISKDTEPATFAERYCKQQMIKKKLNSYNPHQKMTHLMKNFKELDTFVDLPQLILAIKKWKFRQMKSSQVPKQSFIIRQQKTDQTLHKKIKKQLGDKIKQKYLNQNSQADDVLKFLQKNTTIRSDGLKNNSQNNLNLLFQEVEQQGDDQTWKENFDFLQMLHKAQNIQNYRMEKNLSVNSDQKIKDSELNSKMKRQQTNLLHKITTYLQIILETQHKQKWDKKKYGHKTQHAFSTVDKKNKIQNAFKENSSKENPLKENPLKENLFKENNLKTNGFKLQNEVPIKPKQDYLRNTQVIEQKDNYKSSTFRLSKLKKIPHFHRKNVSETSELFRNKNNFHEESINFKPEQNFFQLTQKSTMNRSIFTNSLHSQINKQNLPINKRNDFFYRTTSSFKFRLQATLDQFPPEGRKQKYHSLIKHSQTLKQATEHKRSKNLVKENFTFRNRNIKQKIVNKISNFIRDIDQEEHNNRRQNNYYTSAINKLENTMSMSFGQFRQETLAGDADIQTLKKYATYYNGSGPNVPMNINYFKQLITLNQGGLFNEASNNASQMETDMEMKNSLIGSKFAQAISSGINTL